MTLASTSLMDSIMGHNMPAPTGTDLTSPGGLLAHRLETSMTTKVKTNRRDRRRRDRAAPTYAPRHLNEEAGWALGQCAAAQQVLAHVLSISESWVSRQVHGHESGAAQRFYQAVRDLTAAHKTDAGALIAGALAVATEEAVDLAFTEILRRLSHALAREAAAEGRENEATGRVQQLLGRLSAMPDGRPNGSTLDAELREAMQEHDRATREEMGWHITALIYSRALRVHMGWRKA